MKEDFIQNHSLASFMHKDNKSLKVFSEKNKIAVICAFFPKNSFKFFDCGRFSTNLTFFAACRKFVAKSSQI
jgi:hypothetical protein